MKEIMDKLDFMKIKNFCSAKANIERIRRQATNWEKIFAKDTCHKELLSKIYEVLLKPQQKQNQKHPQQEKKHSNLKNGPMTLTETSPKKLHRWQMANKHMKRCPICQQGNM